MPDTPEPRSRTSNRTSMYRTRKAASVAFVLSLISAHSVLAQRTGVESQPSLQLVDPIEASADLQREIVQVQAELDKVDALLKTSADNIYKGDAQFVDSSKQAAEAAVGAAFVNSKDYQEIRKSAAEAAAAWEDYKTASEQALAALRSGQLRVAFTKAEDAYPLLQEFKKKSNEVYSQTETVFNRLIKEGKVITFTATPKEAEELAKELAPRFWATRPEFAKAFKDASALGNNMDYHSRVLIPLRGSINNQLDKLKDLKAQQALAHPPTLRPPSGPNLPPVPPKTGPQPPIFTPGAGINPPIGPQVPGVSPPAGPLDGGSNPVGPQGPGVNPPYGPPAPGAGLPPVTPPNRDQPGNVTFDPSTLTPEERAAWLRNQSIVQSETLQPETPAAVGSTPPIPGANPGSGISIDTETVGNTPPTGNGLAGEVISEPGLPSKIIILNPPTSATPQLELGPPHVAPDGGQATSPINPDSSPRNPLDDYVELQGFKEQRDSFFDGRPDAFRDFLARHPEYQNCDQCVFSGPAETIQPLPNGPPPVQDGKAPAAPTPAVSTADTGISVDTGLSGGTQLLSAPPLAAGDVNTAQQPPPDGGSNATALGAATNSTPPSGQLGQQIQELEQAVGDRLTVPTKLQALPEPPIQVEGSNYSPDGGKTWWPIPSPDAGGNLPNVPIGGLDVILPGADFLPEDLSTQLDNLRRAAAQADQDLQQAQAQLSGNSSQNIQGSPKNYPCQNGPCTLEQWEQESVAFPSPKNYPCQSGPCTLEQWQAEDPLFPTLRNQSQTSSQTPKRPPSQIQQPPPVGNVAKCQMLAGEVRNAQSLTCIDGWGRPTTGCDPAQKAALVNFWMNSFNEAKCDPRLLH